MDLQLIETLAALRGGLTLGQAGAKLRISQSAVSKRLAILEHQVGEPLTYREGRRIALTPRAERLLDAAGPHLAALRAAFVGETAAARGRVSVGVSESILGSWGADLLADVAKQLPEVQLSIHAHRSPAVAERVAAGEYTLGLVAGHGFASTELATNILLF